jgi:hypothetical protein
VPAAASGKAATKDRLRMSPPWEAFARIASAFPHGNCCLLKGPKRCQEIVAIDGRRVSRWSILLLIENGCFSGQKMAFWGKNASFLPKNRPNWGCFLTDIKLGKIYN